MDRSVSPQPIYSAGDCPVCADSGAVLLLRAVGSGRMFFFCPLCGVAWPEPPVDQRLDSIATLTALAPGGVALPTIEEALSSGFPVAEVSFDEWYPLLKDLLS